MSKECRNCGSKNTDIEGVFKNCYSCGLRAPVSWEDNDKPASDERVKSTSVKQQLQNDVDVYGIAYERQHPNGLTERIDPTTIRVIKPVPSSERSHSPTEQPGRFSEEDVKRFNQDAREAYGKADTHHEGMLAVFEYATMYEREKAAHHNRFVMNEIHLKGLKELEDEFRQEIKEQKAKQAELVEENTKMKQFIENFIEHTSSGYDGDALIWALRTEAALTKTPKP